MKLLRPTVQTFRSNYLLLNEDSNYRKKSKKYVLLFPPASRVDDTQQLSVNTYALRIIRS
jgi:hypothetical protein